MIIALLLLLRSSQMVHLRETNGFLNRLLRILLRVRFAPSHLFWGLGRSSFQETVEGGERSLRVPNAGSPTARRNRHVHEDRASGSVQCRVGTSDPLLYHEHSCAPCEARRAAQRSPRATVRAASETAGIYRAPTLCWPRSVQ